MQSSDPFFVDLLADLVPPLSLSAPPSSSDAYLRMDSPVDSFLRDPAAWLAQAVDWAWSMVQAWWPLLVAVAVAALVGSALLAVMVRRARAGAAERASWVEITPPAVLPAEGSHRLWRALAGMAVPHSALRAGFASPGCRIRRRWHRDARGCVGASSVVGPIGSRRDWAVLARCPDRHHQQPAHRDR